MRGLGGWGYCTEVQKKGQFYLHVSYRCVWLGLDGDGVCWWCCGDAVCYVCDSIEVVVRRVQLVVKG